MCGDAGWEQVTSWWGGRPQPRPALRLVFIDFSPNLQATSTELIFGPRTLRSSVSEHQLKEYFHEMGLTSL